MHADRADHRRARPNGAAASPGGTADDTNNLANRHDRGLVAAVSTARRRDPNAVAPTLSVIACIASGPSRDGNEDTSSSSVTACHATGKLGKLYTICGTSLRFGADLARSRSGRRSPERTGLQQPLNESVMVAIR